MSVPHVRRPDPRRRRRGLSAAVTATASLLLSAAVLPLAGWVTTGHAAAATGLDSGPSPRVPQAAPRWFCDRSDLLFRHTSTHRTTVEHIELPYGWHWDVGTLDKYVNAVGYNPHDREVYGWNQTDQDLIRVSADLATTSYPRPAGMGAHAYVAGDFDPDGRLWLMSADRYWAEVEFYGNSAHLVASGRATGTVEGPADWSWVEDGPHGRGLYGVRDGRLMFFDPYSHDYREISATHGLPTGDYGSSWSGDRDRMYVLRNSDGAVFEVDLHGGYAYEVTRAEGAPETDGARCVERRESTLHLVKQINGQRLLPTDQFTVSLRDWSGHPLTSATTHGNDPRAFAPPWPVMYGEPYTITDEMENPPPSSIHDYDTRLHCDVNGRPVDVHEVGPGHTWELKIIDSGDYNCLVENTPREKPAIHLVKSVTPIGALRNGEQLDYTFVATNTGNVPLHGVTVADLPAEFTGHGTLGPISCTGPDPLLPGEETVCHATYTVVPADVTQGSVHNGARATGSAPDGHQVTDDASADVQLEAKPRVELQKSVSPDTVTHAGEQVTYTYQVTNTGNVTLTDPAVTDTVFTGTGTPPAPSCPTGELLPGGSVDCTAHYTLTQHDIDAGKVDNTATATAQVTGGGSTTSRPSSAEVTAPRTPELAITKTVTPTLYSNVGGELHYTFVVTNTGNTTVGSLGIHDTTTASGGPLTIHCPSTPAELAPGGSITCTADYTVRAGDVQRETIENTATAHGRTHNGTEVTSPEAHAVAGTAPSALDVVKTASPTHPQHVGDPVTYTFKVTNTGAVPLTSVTLHETEFTGSGHIALSCPSRALAAGDSFTCTGHYTVSQADADQGSINNTAVATGTAPDGTGAVSGPAGAHVTIPANGRLELTKTAHTPHPGRPVRVGETVTWTLTVRNTGTTAVQGISVTDPDAGPVTCPGTTLAPGKAMTCTLPAHTVTKEDARAGRVVNTATVHGFTPNGEPVPPATATASVPVHHGGHLPPTGADNDELTLFGLAGAATIALGAVVLNVAARRR